MNEGLIPSRYAKALHLYAEEAGKAAAVYEQTERLAAGYEAHPQMSRAVENPFLPRRQAAAAACCVGRGERRVSDKFFKLVFSHGRNPSYAQWHWLTASAIAMSTRFHRLRLPQRQASARLSWTKSRTPCKHI